jgi:hypothetical protein
VVWWRPLGSRPRLVAGMIGGGPGGTSKWACDCYIYTRVPTRSPTRHTGRAVMPLGWAPLQGRWGGAPAAMQRDFCRI